MFDSYDWYAIPHNRFNTGSAHTIANQFATIPGIARVELYGSISRDGVGNDIDILLVVDDEKTYINFVSEVLHQVNAHETSKEHSGAQYRARAVEHIFGKNMGIIRERMHVIPDDTGSNPYLYLDMFVVPWDWRSRLDELQGHLPHDDPKFMKNVARDAWVIAVNPDP